MREIIDVPVVRTVVSLIDDCAPSRSDEMVRDFVLTGQVERNLGAVAQSIREGKGRGFFLVAPYGSGKSHFLSYVSLVTSGQVMPADGSPLAAAMAGKRLMPVRLSLVSVRGSVRLEDAVLDRMEETFAEGGSSRKFTRRSRFVEYVEEAVRPLDPGGMDEYLASKGLPAWDDLRRDKRRAAEAAWGWIGTLPDRPKMPEDSPGRLLLDAIGEARGLGYEGLIFLIDELSEFLRSKPSKAALSEDARYLQLLGEMSETGPMWIIASLQETIERSGDIARDVIGKIKDRYPATLSLDENHIRELIDGRLIRKKANAREVIRDVWHRLTESLPGFTIDFDSFYRIYPLHPATIRFLEGMSALMSSHRGVVDFIVRQVRGDPAASVPGMLDQPSDRLVTADAIYRHFRDRISRDDRFSTFDTQVRRDLARAIEDALGDDSDRSLAVRAGDILILNEIAELERPKTVAELVDILAVTISEVSPESNEQYLAEVVLEPVAKRCLFMRAERAERAGDRVFRISLDRDRKGLFEKELEGAIRDVTADDSRVFRAIGETIPAEVPIRELIRGGRPEVIIPWRGTQRRGRIFWSEATSLAEVESETASGDFDFALIIAGPGENTSDEPLPPRTLLWIPRFEDAEQDAARRFFGALLLAAEALSHSVERAVAEEARRFVEDEKPAMARIIESAYRRGRFVGDEIDLPCSSGTAGAATFVGRMAQEPIVEMLRAAHPRFLEVAPVVDFVSRRSLSPLVDAILGPGRISMAAARKNGTRMMIDGVLVQMGIAKAVGPSFIMDLDTSRDGLVREVFELVDSHGGDLPGIFRSLRFGPWGLPNDMICLLIAAMVRGGLVILKSKGRKIPSNIAAFSHVAEADAIEAGEIISKSLQEKLFADPLLSRGLDQSSFSLMGQRGAWERLLAFRRSFEEASAEILPRLGQMSEYPVFDSFDFERVRQSISRGMEILREVREGDGSSKGLSRYLDAERLDFVELWGEMERVRRFVTGDADRVIRIADYLRDLPPDGVMPEDVLSHLEDVRGHLSNLTDVVIAGNTESLVGAFDAFHGRYTVWYVDWHRRAFARERFEPLEAIFRSKGFEALSFAGRISGIHIVDDAAAVDRKINAALSRRCRLAPSAELPLRARCRCGFVPGEDVRVEDAKAMEGMIASGLGEVIAAFGDAALRERLVAGAVALRDIDVEKGRRLEAFLGRLAGGLTVDSLPSTLTPDLAGILDEVLTRPVRVVTRRAGDLVEKISGRRLPPDRLKGLFAEWLGETGQGDVLIDIAPCGADGGGGASSVDVRGEERASEASVLLAWIGDHGLDEGQGRLTLAIPSDVVPAGEGEACEVGADRLERMIALSGLKSADGAACIDLLRRERRSHFFAWEIARALAVHFGDGWQADGGCDIVSRFDDVKVWCRAAADATRRFRDSEIWEMMRGESGRERSLSFILEHHHRRDFPSAGVMERMTGRAVEAAVLRDELFASLPEWNIHLEDMMKEYEGACVLFVDAARFDMLPGFADLVEGISKRRLVRRMFFRTLGATTGAWQRLFFGTDDGDAVASILVNRDMRYVGDVERADVRSRLREENRSGALWLNAGFIDRMIHGTSMPFYRIMEESAGTFEDMMTDIAPILSDSRPFIILTDHGFSEHGEGSRRRYGHGSPCASEEVSAALVFA